MPAPTLVKTALAPVPVFGSGTGATASVAVDNNHNQQSGTFDPSGAAWGNYPRVRWSFTGTFDATPTGNPAVLVGLRLSADGGTTNFETYRGTSLFPVRPHNAVMALDVDNATQTVVSEEADLPAVPFKVIVVNSETGAQLQSGWTLLAIPVAEKVVS